MIGALAGMAASLGGLGLVKFLFLMPSEKRKAKAEAELKELETDEKEISVMKGLVESLKERIEQQDAKIEQLNERVDWLYGQKHKLERENNELLRENALLKVRLVEANRNLCVRPDDECFKGRMPKRTYCRLKKLAQGDYDAFYTTEADEESENSNEQEEVGEEDESTGIPKKSCPIGQS